MTLRGRLQRLERTAAASDPLADDLQYQLWRAFYETTLGSNRFHAPFAKSVDVTDAR
jgi:hypothetical protein